MKVEKKRLTQATALILALILVLTGVCTGGFSNLYSLKRSIADGTDTTKEITAFDALSGSVSTQELAVGATESDIVFPKELKATMVERKKVAATVNETKPASVDNNAQKEGTVVPAVNPTEAAPIQTPAQAPEGAAANPADGTSEGAANPAEAAPEGASNPTETAPEGAQQSTPAQTPEGAANSTPVQAPAAATESAPAASESTAPESAPASTEGSSENTSGGINAAENESTAPTNNDSLSESGNGLTGSVRKLTQIFALRNVQAEELTGTNAQTSDSTTSGNETQTSDSATSSSDTQTTETASGETTTTTNVAGTENGAQTTTTGTDAQTTGTQTELAGGTTDAAAVSTPETSVPTSEAATETTNTTVATPQTPAAQPTASTVTVSETNKDKFETTTTQTITLSDISWRIDAGASSGSAFSSEKAGATFVYVPVISGGYTVSADLPRITVKIVDELRPEVELTQIVDGIKITLRAEKGVFPAGVTMTARRVTDYEEDNVENAVEEVRKEEKNVVDSYTFDIKVLDKNGNEIQPDTSKGKVSVSFTMEEVTNDNLEADVYHIKGKELAMSAEELNEKTTNGDTVEAKTNGFSYYTVEFTYNDLQYVLPGGSAAPLSQVLTAVGLTGTVVDARGSNPELFTVGKVAVQADGTPVKDALGNPIADENGVWYVVSKAAFSTDEWMKVTIGGIEYEIKVTDTAEVEITTEDELRAATNSGTQYYLGRNIILTQGAWEIAADKEISLNLNGHVLCQSTNADSAYVITIRVDSQSKGKLILTDTPKNGSSTPHYFDDNWQWNEDASTTQNVVSGGIITRRNNRANGIGILNHGTLVMTGGSVVGNTHNGISNNQGGAEATLENVTIAHNNTAYKGGGIDNAGIMTMTNCSVTGNKASTCGGGIYNTGSSLTMTGGSITDNISVMEGAGLSNGYGESAGQYVGTATLENVTVSGNIAQGGKAGGIYNAYASNLTLNGSTITRNTGQTYGGIYKGNSSSLSLQGKVIVKDNLDNAGKPSNIVLDTQNALTISGALTSGSEIHVKWNGAEVQNKQVTTGFSTKNQDNAVAFFKSDVENYSMEKDKTSNEVFFWQKCNITQVPTANAITYGQTLQDSTLSGGQVKNIISQTSINGTFAWKEPTKVPPASNSESYVVEFTPDDAPTSKVTCNVSLVVNKANINPTVSIADWNFGQTPSTPSVTGNAGDGAVTYEYKVKGAGDETYSSTVPSAVGEYTIRATIAATTNYNGNVTTNDFKINKANITPTVSIADWNFGQTPSTPSVTGNSGDGAVTYNYKEKGAGDDKYSTTVPSAVGEYTIRATIAETTNYKGGEATSDFKINKTPITPIVAINGWKAGAVPYPPSVTGNTGGGAVTYAYKVKGAGDETYSATVPTKAGTYTVKADVAQTATYAAGSATTDFVIFQDAVETKSEAKDGAPNVTVEGLADVLTDEEKTAAGATSVYEINFTADKKTESTATGVPQIKALLAGNQQLETLLDLTLYKTTTTLASDSTKTITKTDNIGGSNTKVLGLAIPYQTAGRTLLLLRFHGGTATKLTALNAKPTGGYTDGTYFIDTTNNMIYVYASGYSTYAIAVETASGGGSSSGGSSSSGSSSSSSNNSNNSNNNAQPAATPAAQPAAVQTAAAQPAAQDANSNTAKKSNGKAKAAPDTSYVEETATVTEDITDYQPTTDTDKTTMTAKVSTDEPKQTTSNTEATPKKNKGLGILLLILLLVVAGGVILVATSNAGKRKN